MSARRILQGAVAAIAFASALVISATLAAPIGAEAFWTANSSSASAGAAGTASVNQGSTPTVAVQSRSNVVVSWAATTMSNGLAATGYTVSRFADDGTQQGVLTGCAGVRTTLTCTEAGLPDGDWTYAITPQYRNWLGAASTPSTPVLTDTTAPVNAITLGSVAGGASKVGNTVFYRGAAAGSFTLVNALTDVDGSGPASSGTGTLSGTRTGWSHTASTVATPTGGPFTSNPFSWTVGTTSSPTLGVAGVDAYGNTAAASLTFTVDNTAPTGGAISYANGGTNAASIAISLAAVADAASGPTGGTRSLQRQTSTITNNACSSTYSSWAEVVANVPATASVQTVPLTAGQCSKYRYVFTDGVGNTTTTTSTSIVKAKDYSAAVLGTAGLLSSYSFGDTGSTTTDAVGSNSGTQSGTTTGASAIAGDDGVSKYYNGSTDYNRVNRTIGASFTIEFWFKSSQNFGSGTQWYNGAGLVDAEVAGAQNDFGIALLAGRVVAGTGNPDRSISSLATYNDNAWHHVVMTRAQGGNVTLYVDGASQGTVASNANVLNASAFLDFGRLQTGINSYQGYLDEVALYGRALSASEVAAHYQAGNAL